MLLLNASFLIAHKNKTFKVTLGIKSKVLAFLKQTTVNDDNPTLQSESWEMVSGKGQAHVGYGYLHKLSSDLYVYTMVRVPPRYVCFLSK